MEESKKILLGYVAATLAFFVGLFLYAKFGPGLPLSVTSITSTKGSLFSVSAEGKTLAKPDTAQVTLGFTATGISISQVQTQANQTINNIVGAVKKLGVGEGDIKTTNYNLNPNYDFSGGSQRIKGYTVNVNIEVKVRDFDKINSVIDAGTANGANQVGNLSLTVDDPEKFRSEARKQAIAKAKEKASEIAKETGITLGKIVGVEEATNNLPRPISLATDMKSGLGGGETQVEPGSSEITVNVTLSYETR